MSGLFDRPRSGRPERHGPSTRLTLVATATSVPPEGDTVWTRGLIVLHLAERGLALSPSTLGRVLAEAKTRPHKVRGWLNRSDDGSFWAQADAVCRLCLALPAGTVLVSVDEKTGIQAKSRRFPAPRATPHRQIPMPAVVLPPTATRAHPIRSSRDTGTLLPWTLVGSVVSVRFHVPRQTRRFPT